VLQDPLLVFLRIAEFWMSIKSSLQKARACQAMMIDGKNYLEQIEEFLKRLRVAD
jgi:hypothetical protein